MRYYFSTFINVEAIGKIMDVIEELNKLKQMRGDMSNSINLERKQISANNPAHAQLWIIIPKSVNPPEDLQRFYSRFYANSPETFSNCTFKEVDPHEYIVEIKSSLRMYSWFERFIISFKEVYGKYGQGYKVRDSGTWDKYGE